MKPLTLLPFLLATLALGETGGSGAACAKLAIKSGTRCRSLQADFDLKSCQEASVPAVITCEGKLGHALGRTAKGIYHSVVKELASGVWIPVGEVHRYPPNWKLPSAAALPSFTKKEASTPSAANPWDLGGQARLRYWHDELLLEERNRSYFTLRVRPDFYFYPNPSFNFFFQPQLATVAGLSSTDPTLQVHQAFLEWHLTNQFDLIAGRQILAYGDETLLGASDQDMEGRSFDAVRLRWSTDPGFLDFFAALLEERSYPAAGSPDKKLLGLYSSFPLGQLADAFEPYLLWLSDSDSGDSSLASLGMRVESSFEPWDFQGEITVQKGYSEGQQAWAELGISLSPRPVRVAIRPFWLSKDFNALLPSRFATLGKAGFLGQRNLCGTGATVSAKLSQNWGLSLEAFYFLRTDNQAPVFRHDGKTPVASSLIESQALGTEWDLQSKWQLADQLTLTAGAYVFFSSTDLGSDFPSTLGRGELTLELVF